MPLTDKVIADSTAALYPFMVTSCEGFDQLSMDRQGEILVEMANSVYQNYGGFLSDLLDSELFDLFLEVQRSSN